MRYKEKAQVLRNRPFTYDDNERFHRGAWRHWEGYRNRDGDLTFNGRRLAENDRDFLSRRLRAKSQGFVLGGTA